MDSSDGPRTDVFKSSRSRLIAWIVGVAVAGTAFVLLGGRVGYVGIGIACVAICLLIFVPRITWFRLSGQAIGARVFRSDWLTWGLAGRLPRAMMSHWEELEWEAVTEVRVIRDIPFRRWPFAYLILEAHVRRGDTVVPFHAMGLDVIERPESFRERIAELARRHGFSVSLEPSDRFTLFGAKALDE